MESEPSSGLARGLASGIRNISLEESSYSKVLQRMNQNASPTMSVSSTSSAESAKQESASVPPRHPRLLGRLRKATKLVVTTSRMGRMMDHANTKEHKRDLKVVREYTDDRGRLIRSSERRRCHVDLTDVAVQTDFSEQESRISIKKPDSSASVSTPQSAPLTPQASLSSVLGSKKEKPMSMDSGLALIPSLYEQYLTMLANPGPDTAGKHLNFITFTQSALIRKFGIKKIATKQYRTLAALMDTKKAMKHPRFRIFASLYGLAMKSGGVGPGYKPDYVDFFFQKLLVNVFPGIKQVRSFFFRE